MRLRRQQAFQRVFHRGVGGCRGWQAQAVSVQAELDARRHFEVLVLAPETEVLPLRAIGHQRGPVGLAHEGLELGHRAPRGVGTTDHRAHAGADHDVHRHAQLLQHAQHADMREAARATAREHQRDARSGRGHRFRRFLGLGGKGGQQQRAGQQEPAETTGNGHAAIVSAAVFGKIAA